jgi:hypothetical protein
LPRDTIDELTRHDFFDGARGALDLDAVIALEQGDHFLTRRIEQLSDLVNPDSGQIRTSYVLRHIAAHRTA